MRTLTKAITLSVLALWGLAAMHCKLEVVPGFGFLQSCCNTTPASQNECQKDGCGAVEQGTYRVEEQAASVPQPILVLVLFSVRADVPIPELQVYTDLVGRVPPEIPQGWQFFHRAALLPRAPSIPS